jgi:predicted ribosome quality control (RQC) complex YloA/Tae2 family protein
MKPTLDARFYGGLAAELDERLRGLEVRGIEDPVVEGRTPEGMLLRFAGEPGGLMVSLNRDCPGVFWTRSVAGRRTVRGLAQRLLPRIQGAVVQTIRQPAPDRVLEIQMDGREGRRSLWLEMTGRLGNLILTDSEGIILVVGRAVFAGMSRVRRLEVGLPYVQPPLPPGWAVNRNLAEVGAPLPDSFNDRAERAYLERERELAIRRKRGELGAGVRGRLTRRQRLLERLQAELAEAGQGDQHRTDAEHLAAHLHLVRRGQAELVCERFDGEGPIRVGLDPARSPQENLDLLFKRARKAERSRDVLTRRTAELRAELAALEHALKAVEAAGSWEALLEVERELPPGAAEARPEDEERLPPGVAAFRSSDGLTILVGRTAQGNQSVTFALGRPRDLWLHARDYPGSHVVLRRIGKKEPPARSVLEAAALAAHFSKAAGQLVVDVACCMRYQVRAPRGASPGKVQYSGEKTISVRMQPELLAPLLHRGLDAALA